MVYPIAIDVIIYQTLCEDRFTRASCCSMNANADAIFKLGTRACVIMSLFKSDYDTNLEAHFFSRENVYGGKQFEKYTV